MKVAAILAFLVLCAGSAFASTIESGSLIPAQPYTYEGSGDNPTNVAVFMDYYPWGYNTVVEILVQHGVSHTVYGSGSMASVDLTPFDKVIICSNQDQNFYNQVQANRARFESFMSDGGCMLMCCAEYFGYGSTYITWPGGFMHVEVECINAMTIMEPTHPVFNDPYVVGSGDLQGWYCSSHGTFSGLPAGAVVTIENAELAPGTPAAFDFCWGAGGGYVIAQPIDWVGNAHPYVRNVVLYTCSASPSPAEPTTWGALKSLYK